MITRELNVREDLCISCGACAFICPNKCISFERNKDGRDVVKVDKDKCVRCGLCFKACPISEVKSIDNIRQIQKEEEECNYNYKDNCYLGYAKDKEHRFNAATAGVATQLAKDLLNKGIMDCALLVKGDNKGYEVYLAKDASMVEASVGSKYRPINLLSSNLDIKNQLKEFKNIIVIGLPCHINAIYNISKNSSFFREKNLLTVSIFCKQNKDLRFSEYVRKLCGEKKTSASIKYRGEGWPGKISTCDGLGNRKSISFNHPKVSALFATRAYSLNGCFLCTDSLGNVADISLGDAWNKEVMDRDSTGSEYIICNTEEGRERLLECENIFVEKTDFEDILKAQGKGAIEKKTRLAKDFYNYYISNVKNEDVMKAIKIKKIFENSIVSTVLRKSPTILVKVFFRFVLRGEND